MCKLLRQACVKASASLEARNCCRYDRQFSIIFSFDLRCECLDAFFTCLSASLFASLFARLSRRSILLGFASPSSFSFFDRDGLGPAGGLGFGSSPSRSAIVKQSLPARWQGRGCAADEKGQQDLVFFDRALAR